MGWWWWEGGQQQLRTPASLWALAGMETACLPGQAQPGQAQAQARRALAVTGPAPARPRSIWAARQAHHLTAPPGTLLAALQLLERRAGNQAFQGRRLPEALHAYSRALAIVEFVRVGGRRGQAGMN